MRILPFVLVSGVLADSHLLPSNPHAARRSDDEVLSVSGFSNPSIHQSTGGQAVCVSGTISVKASTNKGLKFDYSIPKNESQVTETWVDFVTKDSPFTDQIMGGYETISGTYEIGATHCVPAGNSKPKAVQLLTHGVGFSRSYWDFAPGYSYVDYAASYGYAVFFYDRLSVGTSSKPPPLEVQTSIELEILYSLATMLREGKISGTPFSTIVGAGHSYGSILTQALTSAYPTAIDAAILTGFSVYEGAMPTFLLALNLDIAAQNQPARFSGLDDGYLVSSTTISLQTGFFRAPGFAPNILALAEATKGSVTIGELFSTTAVTKAAPHFQGPVAVVNGMEDLPFCFGNCTFKGNLANQVFPKLYPNLPSSKTGTFLAPVAGHGLNLHYSAPEAYRFIERFLKRQGV